MKWIVVANRTDAVVYADGTDKKLHFLRRMRNRIGRKSEAELVSDRPGTGFSSAQGTQRHGLKRRISKHEHVAVEFARRIARTLGAARQEGSFESLVLVAEPHFLGLLRNEMDPPTRRTVKHEVQRELIHHSDQELREKIG